jgi:hypothetical protein
LTGDLFGHPIDREDDAEKDGREDDDKDREHFSVPLRSAHQVSGGQFLGGLPSDMVGAEPPSLRFLANLLLFQAI